MRIFFFSLFIALISSVVSIPNASAATKVCDGDPNLELNASGVCVLKQKPITGTDCAGPDRNALVCIGSASSLILVVLNYAFGIAGTIAIIMIIYGGYVYMTAGGEADNTKKGREIAQNAVIGLVIMILAWTIIQIATRFLATRAF